MNKDLTDPEVMKRILEEFNQSTLDPVGPVGGDQGMTVLKELNELDQEHDQHIQGIGPKLNVL